MSASLVFAAQTCNANKKCPSESPCCSAEGKCGGGALQCTAGCNPLYSYKANACVQNPVCTPINLRFEPSDYNNTDLFVPVQQYTGLKSQGPLLFESGFLGAGSHGVLLELNEGHGSRISTSQYHMYGNTFANMSHKAYPGLITTFGFLSDVGDAAIFQLSGGDGSQISTNYYTMNNIKNSTGTAAKVPRGFDVSKPHIYVVNWQETSIRWLIDGELVNSVDRNTAGDDFPRTPARVVMTAYGVDAQAPQSVRKWSGGMLSYTTKPYTDRGYYAQELTQLYIQCHDLDSLNLPISGPGSSPVAFFYTGQNDTSTKAPQFQLSRDSIRPLPEPTKDSEDDLPGSPNMRPRTSFANMYTGGMKGVTNKNGTAANDDESLPTSTKVKIGIPVGIGGAVVLCVLVLFLFYLLRRHKKQKYVQEDFDTSMHQPAHAPPMGIYLPKSESQMHDPHANHPYPPGFPMGDISTDSALVAADHDDKIDPNSTYDFALAEYTETPQDDDELSVETQSTALSYTRSRGHYAGQGVTHKYDRNLTREENQEAAAQSAWEELRYAALGPSNEGSFGHAHSSSLPYESLARPRTIYSRQGAFAPGSNSRAEREDTPLNWQKF
ncbi:hypothetical protein MVES1_001220 [Malassezia vespertilionis]|uniref:uncharacterized protein n=1 Tax=Malassezia vespertilionis TaxID=2020962 RepID=UPI0024B197E0|nr:uncharacterized protein MVES1_001220 [Malassezia vespertilionis]WFD05886.1 hypothetical protein MVES1_001220 [Malassezia vespertilionis]